jgi:hypothetical protein
MDFFGRLADAELLYKLEWTLDPTPEATSSRSGSERRGRRAHGDGESAIARPNKRKGPA